jgi:hypothetical protein
MEIKDKQKISKEFIEAAFILGKELLDKKNPTQAEKHFLQHLDKTLELLEEN